MIFYCEAKPAELPDAAYARPICNFHRIELDDAVSAAKRHNGEPVMCLGNLGASDNHSDLGTYAGMFHCAMFISEFLKAAESPSEIVLLNDTNHRGGRNTKILRDNIRSLASFVRRRGAEFLVTGEPALRFYPLPPWRRPHKPHSQPTAVPMLYGPIRDTATHLYVYNKAGLEIAPWLNAVGTPMGRELGRRPCQPEDLAERVAMLHEMGQKRAFIWGGSEGQPDWAATCKVLGEMR